MRSVTLDKIASVTLNCRLPKDVRVTTRFQCKEGDVVAVRVLTRKGTYNQLELTTGRFSNLQPGDVIAGCLGHRRALLGYAGHVPEKLEPGDTVHLLNLGGVIGICDSFNPDLGRPFECEVLGQVLSFPYLGERIGVPANIEQGVDPALRLTGGAVTATAGGATATGEANAAGEEAREAPSEESAPRRGLAHRGVPVLAVVGTCMNSGKTLACTNLIQELSRAGKKVHAAKCTGVSLRRDILSMEDAGAARTMIFTDLGVVTTTRKNSAQLTRRMIESLASAKPDVIVLELGDGLLGDYGVDAILEDADVRQSIRAVVLAANDPVGVWGGARLLEERYGMRPTAITGPATDNVAGTDFVQRTLGIPAHNARVAPHKLAEVVSEAMFGASATAAAGSANHG